MSHVIFAAFLLAIIVASSFFWCVAFVEEMW